MITIERRKKIALFLISLLILIFLFYTNDFGIKSRVEDLRVSEDEYQELIEKRTASVLENTFQLKVDDQVLPYDEVTNSFLVSLDELAYNEEANPIFEIIMANNHDYDIALLGERVSEDTIKNNHTVKLLVYSDTHFDEFDIHFTTLPIFSLTIDNSLESERPIGDSDQRASMTLYSSDETITSDLYIRLRGATSRSFPKNQYRINLREFTIGGDEKLNHQSLLGMREDDDWIIYSPYNDPEKVRNTLSNNLWHDIMGQENRFNINTGTEGRYVEVFINNRYWGLYTLMHPIDAKQLDLNLEDEATESDIYYRSISNLGVEPHDFERSTGKEKVLGRFELKEPEEPFGTPEQWDPLYNHMMMHRADIASLEEYLFNQTDIQNQINYYLFALLLQATDNNFKNRNYISKLAEETRVMLESPWDLDLTWGLHWHPEDPRLAIVKGDPEVNYLPTASLVYMAIYKGNEKITQMVKEKYNELRTNEWSQESFMERLDEYENEIYNSGAILRDKERWPDTAYNEDMEEFRNYVLKRLKALDDFIANDI